ncbi:MAG: integrase core domain-containing protein [Thermoanaerobaculales bacterium]|nr:integrase core domain-containing protein [Thermoanaerobaculales bacterium]
MMAMFFQTLAVLPADVFRIVMTVIGGALGPAVKIASLKAENLFLRKQLGLYREREAPRRRTNKVFRRSMVLLSRFFDWPEALVIVNPETFVRWHRDGFKRFWRWRSRHTRRPSIPPETVALIRRIASENITLGQEKIAEVIRLQLGVFLSPRTIARYIRDLVPPRNPAGRGGQRWATFVRNHARTVVAMDFVTVVSATFHIYYVLVVMEIGSRKILHTNVTTSPNAAWVSQQLREAIPCDHSYRFLIHDRDSIFNAQVDDVIRGFGIHPLKTPVRAPKANTFCERLIGTIRRDCLDYLIPLSENHLRMILREYIDFYNHHRPHSSLGPGIPDPAEGLPVEPQPDRHRLPESVKVVSTPILGGLHHTYRIAIRLSPTGEVERSTQAIESSNGETVSGVRGSRRLRQQSSRFAWFLVTFRVKASSPPGRQSFFLDPTGPLDRSDGVFAGDTLLLRVVSRSFRTRLALSIGRMEFSRGTRC